METIKKIIKILFIHAYYFGVENEHNVFNDIIKIHALKYHLYFDYLVILSGNLGGDLNLADALKEFLIANGVPEEKIIVSMTPGLLEEKPLVDTWEEVDYALDIAAMLKEELEGPFNFYVLVINWHATRTMLIYGRRLKIKGVFRAVGDNTFFRFLYEVISLGLTFTYWIGGAVVVFINRRFRRRRIAKRAEKSFEAIYKAKLE